MTDLADATIDPLQEELRAHPDRRALGALALDILGRQAEGRVLFAGREYVRKKAEEHGVTRDAARTSLGNVLDLLERGAETERERALVLDLAVLGLEDAVEGAKDAHARTIVARTVRQALWLELATPLAFLTALAKDADGAAATLVGEELAQLVVDTSVGDARRGVHARAQSMALLAALGVRRGVLASRGDAGLGALDGRLAQLAVKEGLDPVVRRVAGDLAGGAAGAESLGSRSELVGRAVRVRPSGAGALLRWVTGWAMLAAVGRAFAALLGHQHEVELKIEGKDLVVRETRRLLGRAVREARTTVAVTSLLAASREVRHAVAPLYAGAFTFAASLLVGAYLLFDGARSGELMIAAVGAGAILVGLVVDVVTDVVARRAGGSAVVELVLPRSRVVRVGAAGADVADAFLRALRR